MKRNYLKGGRRNWRIRFIDETGYLSDDARAMLPAETKLISAYIFDPGEVTHLCSFQGSQWHVGICTFLVPPDYDTWEQWSEDDEDGEKERLRDELELSGPPEDDYFGDQGEDDSFDSGIRVRRFRSGDVWTDACSAHDYEGTPGETNWEEAASQLIESEHNSWVSNLYYQEQAKQAVLA